LLIQWGSVSTDDAKLIKSQTTHTVEKALSRLPSRSRPYVEESPSSQSLEKLKCNLDLEPFSIILRLVRNRFLFGLGLLERRTQEVSTFRLDELFTNMCAWIVRARKQTGIHCHNFMCGAEKNETYVSSSNVVVVVIN
jgi:hypothetical protein